MTIIRQNEKFYIAKWLVFWPWRVHFVGKLNTPQKDITRSEVKSKSAIYHFSHMRRPCTTEQTTTAQIHIWCYIEASWKAKKHHRFVFLLCSRKPNNKKVNLILPKHVTSQCNFLLIQTYCPNIILRIHLLELRCMTILCASTYLYIVHAWCQERL